MIEEQDVVLAERVRTVIGSADSRVSVVPIATKGDRPFDLEIGVGSNRWLEPAFVSRRLVSKSGGLQPVLQVAYLGEQKSVCVLEGELRWLLIDLQKAALIDKVDLNRTAQEDAGFYRVEFREIGPRTFGIYESGVVSIAVTGNVLWHVKKSWDEEFLAMKDGQLILAHEAGTSCRIEPLTGTVSRL